MFSDFDITCMQWALTRAEQALHQTYPNPHVGAVIAHDGVILSDGYHKKAGADHAEINALKKLGWPNLLNKKIIQNATLYVTLEPCKVTGKTPPCTNAIINSGITRVVIAMKDPHDPKKHGVKQLREHGITVQYGLLEQEAINQNQVFLKNVHKKLPYITAKVASTIDGKIATAFGDSRGISGKESQKVVHKMRSHVQAIITGIGTIIADNPHLGVRLDTRSPKTKNKDPLRVILDSTLRSPLTSKIFRDKNVLVLTTNKASAVKHKAFTRRNIETVSLGSAITPKKILKELFTRGIYHALLETGSKTFTSFFEAKAIDQYVQFIAPKFMGGTQSLPILAGKDIETILNLPRLQNITTEQVGEDILLQGLLNVYR